MNACQVACRLLEGGESAKDFLARHRIGEPGPEHDFGFSVHTSDQFYIEQNAADRGIRLDDQAWETLSQDSIKIEFNVLRCLDDAGIPNRSEGHGSNDGLIGTAWVNERTPAIQILRRYHETGGEAFIDAQGIEHSVPGASFGQIFMGVSDMGADLIDVSLEFFDYEDIPGVKLPGAD